MADVTLKQGIEVEIKQVVPTIKTVLDTTDHAGGQNPYYEPGKSGMISRRTRPSHGTCPAKVCNRRF